MYRLMCDVLADRSYLYLVRRMPIMPASLGKGAWTDKNDSETGSEDIINSRDKYTRALRGNGDEALDLEAASPLQLARQFLGHAALKGNIVH